MPINKKAKDILDRYNSLKTQRQTWESHWQEVADYMLPRKADITKSRSQGDKRTEFIFDGTATHSLELLAASLHGMLTSTSSPWFY
jgi:Bacteriophage head to tail connecting protein